MCTIVRMPIQLNRTSVAEQYSGIDIQWKLKNKDTLTEESIKENIFHFDF